MVAFLHSAKEFVVGCDVAQQVVRRLVDRTDCPTIATGREDRKDRGKRGRDVDGYGRLRRGKGG